MIRVTGTTGKLVVLGAFFALSMAYLLYLFGKAGVRNPLTDRGSYTLTFEAADVDNLIPVGDVQMAGVKVGRVRTIGRTGGTAVVTVDLDPDAVPLHRGVSVRVGAKSLAGESYVDIVDGQGAPLPSGTRLPRSSVRPAVQLRDVINSLDPSTRKALSGLVHTAGAGTAGTKDDIAMALTGLGQVGREGYTAVDAIAAQSQDLTELARQTTTLLAALNSGQAQLATLVRETQRVTAATSGQSDSLAATVDRLPGLLKDTRTATVKLRDLGTAAAPVTADLREAAPYLDASLRQLPQTSADLRGLLPSLNGTLTKAPATLDRVPTLSADTSALIPQLRTAMTNLNPMLAYLKPYGPELGAFFANFGAMLKYTDEAGIHFFRLEPDLGNDRIVKGVPVRLPDLLTHQNPYPAPGRSNDPTGRPFTRLHPQPN